MKFPLSSVIAALLGLALAACGPAKVKGPDPNPVGQWQWSSNILGSWRLEIKADGTFQREVTTPFNRTPVSTKGRWKLDVTQPESSWLEQHGIVLKTSAS